MKDLHIRNHCARLWLVVNLMAVLLLIMSSAGSEAEGPMGGGSSSAHLSNLTLEDTASRNVISAAKKTGWNLVLVIQDLLHNKHSESDGTPAELPVGVPKTVYLKLTRDH